MIGDLILPKFGAGHPALFFAVLAGLIALAMAVRYVLLAGGAIWLVQANKQKLRAFRIQPLDFSPTQLRRELAYSASTILIFGLVFAAVFFANHQWGWFQIYRDGTSHGPVWFWVSLLLAIVVHDAYFYWAHRFMHLPGIYERVHYVHHLSTNPSPLAAFAFHPLEALIEAGALIVIVTLIPIHAKALILFSFYMFLSNVMGHLGYEFIPKSFRQHKFFSWYNHASSHNLHHRTFRYNYGLYTLFWDRWFGTLKASSEKSEPGFAQQATGLKRN